MNPEQKAIVEQAMRDYLRAVEEFKSEDNVPATLKTIRKLLMIVDLQQAALAAAEAENAKLTQIAHDRAEKIRIMQVVAEQAQALRGDRS